MQTGRRKTGQVNFISEYSGTRDLILELVNFFVGFTVKQDGVALFTRMSVDSTKGFAGLIRIPTIAWWMFTTSSRIVWLCRC